MVVRAALTFDTEHPDRPAEPGMTERLLDVVGAAGVRATFFVQGRWAEAYPATAAAIAADGHLVGSHSHYHARMSTLTDAGIAADLAAAERAIRSWAGADPRPWFRCPFGDGAADPRVQAAVTRAGYRHVGWHVDVRDWRPRLRSRTVAKAVMTGIRAAGDGAIVLLHAWPSATPRAVAAILAGAADDGIEFVRIDELPVEPIATVPW